MYKDKKISVIIAAAGSGKRMGGGLNKQYIVLDGMPVLARSVAVFERNPLIDEIVIVVKAGEEERCRRDIVEAFGFAKVSRVVAGGSERQYSVKAALGAVDAGCDIVLIHDGARPLVSDETVDAVIFACYETGAAVPAVSVKDTIKEVQQEEPACADGGNSGVDGSAEGCESRLTVRGTPDRSRLRAVQTPQGFDRVLLEEAYGLLDRDGGAVVTDDASLVEALGHPVAVVEGEEINIKITTPSDVKKAEIMMGEIKTDMVPRVGMGYDVHAFAEGRKLILGGVDIPHDRGLAGHSDADVLVHAVMDSLLGACAMGDIGRHFPDTDPQYKGIDSLKLLAHVGALLAENGWKIINIDATVIAQRPKIAPHIDKMRENIAEVLKISASQINIKGTTTERLGFEGREEGIAAQSIASIIHI